MKASISILIITYNRVEDTLALLENLREQEELNRYVGEILLLNNNSSDDYGALEEFIKKHPTFPIKYIDHDENLGVARGRNFLIQKAKYPLFLVLDDDVVFQEKDAIKKAASLFSKPQFIENNTAVITLNIHYFDTGLRQPNALPHKKYKEYKDKEWFLTYYFVGAAHLMRRELFQKTKLYPENFFYGMEEYDLSYRIVEAGYTLAYDNSIKVLHKESPLGRITKKEKLAMLWYNKCVVAWRYLPDKYYRTTAFMWSLEYLKNTGFDFVGMFKNMRKVRKIRKQVPIQKISPKALDYLKQVKARLWY